MIYLGNFQRREAPAFCDFFFFLYFSSVFSREVGMPTSPPTILGDVAHAIRPVFHGLEFIDMRYTV